MGEEERYKKIGLDFEAVDRMLVNVFLQAHEPAPRQIVLDLDRTDAPLPGEQEGRFFHGYYGAYPGFLTKEWEGRGFSPAATGHSS